MDFQGEVNFDNFRESHDMLSILQQRAEHYNIATDNTDPVHVQHQQHVEVEYELAQMILDVLISGKRSRNSGASGSTAAALSTGEQVAYMLSNIHAASEATKINMCKVLIANRRQDAMSECNEGVVINLTVLGSDVVDQLYATITRSD